MPARRRAIAAAERMAGQYAGIVVLEESGPDVERRARIVVIVVVLALLAAAIYEGFGPPSIAFSWLRQEVAGGRGASP